MNRTITITADQISNLDGRLANRCLAILGTNKRTCTTCGKIDQQRNFSVDLKEELSVCVDCSRKAGGWKLRKVKAA